MVKHTAPWVLTLDRKECGAVRLPRAAHQHLAPAAKPEPRAIPTRGTRRRRNDEQYPLTRASRPPVEATSSTAEVLP
jgi:hypothetical protein